MIYVVRMDSPHIKNKIFSGKNKDIPLGKCQKCWELLGNAGTSMEMLGNVGNVGNVGNGSGRNIWNMGTWTLEVGKEVGAKGKWRYEPRTNTSFGFEEEKVLKRKFDDYDGHETNAPKK